jgi:SET domain-containing protein
LGKANEALKQSSGGSGLSKRKKANEDRQKMDDVEVRKTAIGRGVFARRRFKKDTIIGEITGVVMPVDFESSYCMDLAEKGVLEPNRPFRFLNHSCMPNCELVHWKHRKVKGTKVPRLWVSAIRGIKKGEELTIDYAWPAEAAIPCHCRAQNCREWIVDPAEISEVRSGRRRMSKA